MAEKIYVGKARYHQFRDGGEICKIWIPDMDLLNQNVNAKGGVNLIMSQMQNPDSAGNTHTLYVDDYVPNQQGGDSNRQNRAPQAQRGGYQQQPPQQRGGYQSRPQRPSGRDNGGFDEPTGNYRQQPAASDHYEDDIPF